MSKRNAKQYRKQKQGACRTFPKWSGNVREFPLAPTVWEALVDEGLVTKGEGACLGITDERAEAEMEAKTDLFTSMIAEGLDQGVSPFIAMSAAFNAMLNVLNVEGDDRDNPVFAYMIAAMFRKLEAAGYQVVALDDNVLVFPKAA